jgi:hypothetical protein
MPAKEERAMHLEMHRMNRASAEMMTKIRALEAECAQLRSVVNRETEKHAATVDAASKQCRTHQDAMDRMKQECAVAMARMEEAHQRAQQEAEAQLKQDMLHQRQSIFDETVVVKRQLNEQYAGFIANKTKELDAVKHALEEETAAEKKARKQREEEHLAQFFSRMEELNKLKAETVQKSEDAKRRMEEDHRQQLAARDQREEELKRQHRLLMDEANRLNAETVQKLEDAKRRAEEDHTQQLAAREEEIKRQCRLRIDEIKRLNTETVQKLEDARRRAEEDHKQQLAARDQREEELKRQSRLRMDEANRLNAETVQKLEDAKRRAEEGHKQQLVARDQREEEFKRQCRLRMDEASRLNAETVQKLEDAKRRAEADHAQQLAAREEEIKRQCRLRMDEANRLNAETVQKLEDARRRTEEDHAQQLAANKAKLDAQLQKCAALKDALVRCNQERTELTTLAETKFEDYVKTHTAQVIKTVSALQICQAVAANYAHMRMVCADLDFNGKRVLIYSHYSKQETVEKYNYLTLEKMQHWFDYVIVLTNCPNQWQFDSPNYLKCHVMWYNLKSDFRNYGVFIAQAGQRLMGASQVCFANDSFVIVDVPAFDRCMARMFDSADSLASHDFMGITSSYENTYHLQSYFMCFNARTLDAVMGYFKTHGLPMNHHDAISVYELGITKHLMARGFKPFAMVSNQEMPVPLNTTCFKWSAVLQNTGIIKRQHFLKQYPPRFAMTDLNIELVATKFSENKHFVQFLHEHGITPESKPGIKPEYKNKLYHMN